MLHSPRIHFHPPPPLVHTLQFRPGNSHRFRAGLALYQESENLAFYAAFVVGTSVCGGYFLHANFWFLDIAIGGAPLQAVLFTIGLAFVPALLLPALVRATAATADGFSRLLWLNMVLIQQGNLVLITEELLFVGCALC